jgi:hypothetical protein
MHSLHHALASVLVGDEQQGPVVDAGILTELLDRGVCGQVKGTPHQLQLAVLQPQTPQLTKHFFHTFSKVIHQGLTLV